MTGSEHTAGALVCAALQRVGYQRPLPRDGRRLCPRQAYLTTRLIRPRPPDDPSLPTRRLDYSSNLLSTTSKESRTHYCIPSYPIPPHPVTTPIPPGHPRGLHSTRLTAQGSQYGSPSRQSSASAASPREQEGVGGFRLPVSDRLTARVLTLTAADPRCSYLP